MPRLLAVLILSAVSAVALWPSWAFAGTCTNPSGNEGEFFYNTDFKVMQYCDGTSWVGMAGGAVGTGGGGGFTALTGDVTATGTGSVAATIANSAVTYAKLQNTSAASVLLGRGSASGAGAIQEITLGSGLALTGTVLSASGSSSGTSGYIQFSGGSGVFASSSTTAGQQFFWDETNHRLGIGLVAPTQALDVTGKMTANSLILKVISGAPAPTAGSGLWTTDGTNVWRLTGNVGLGTATPDTKAILDLTSVTKGFLPPRMTTSQRDAITSPATGLTIFNSTTAQLEYYNGTGWTAPGGSGMTSGIIAAFAATSCPSGWTEYTAARGRFLRGIDPSGATTVDPSGTRAPGNQQADLTKISLSYDASGVAGNLLFANGSGNTLRFETNGTYGSIGSTGVETRPKNVAVIFCQYSGSGGGGGGSTTLAGLTDVDTTGIASGKVLAYNGTKWAPASASGGSSSGTAGYVQFSGGSGAFSSDNTASNQFFWDATNHKLGIGTTSPTAPLHVIDNSGNGIVLERTTATARKWNTLVLTTGALDLYDQTAGADRMVISTTGNVGIGTTTPSVALSLTYPGSNSGYANVLRLVDDGSASNSTTGNSYGFGIQGSDGRFSQSAGTGGYLSYYTANAQRMVIANSGQVYMYSLPNYATGYYICIYNNGLNYGASCSGSDIRLKKSIKDLTGSLDKIVRLQGVSYEWRHPEERGYGRNIGLIAQAVEKVYPEVVNTDKNGMKSLQYEKLVAPLIEAVKELKADNDNLRAMVEQQGRELESYKATHP